MKTSSIIITFLCIVLFSTPMHAQFWKKIGEKAEKAVERTLERKVEEKTERETEKTFDTIFNNKGKLFKGKKSAPIDIYSFTHIYEMAIVSDKDTMPVTYYLTNEGKYMGFSTKVGKEQQIVTVMDATKKTSYVFMDMGGIKTMSSMPLDFEKVTIEEMSKDNEQITATGRNKDILGYSCSEYEVVGNDFEGTIWVTQDADITFSSAFDTLKQKRKSRGSLQKVLKLIDGLTLEIDMTDTSKKKQKPMKMICVALKENNFSIKTSEYQK